MKCQTIMNMVNQNNAVEPFVLSFEITRKDYELKTLYETEKRLRYKDPILLRGLMNIISSDYEEVISIYAKEKNNGQLDEREQKLLSCVDINITRCIPLMSIPTARLMMASDSKRNL